MTISLDLVTGALSLLFTVMVLSYLIGDNPLFKIAVYLFVGVASGYAAAIVIWQVLVPKLFLPTWNIVQTRDLSSGILLVAPWLGIAFILMKISPRLAGTARIAMAYLVGVGAAVTLVGALTGTIIPQVEATANFFDGAIFKPAAEMIEIAFSGGIILLGTVTSLAYFHFGARQQADGTTRRSGIVNLLAWIGSIFIGSTLGAVFAGVYAAALTALIERISSIVNFFMSLLGIA